MCHEHLLKYVNCVIHFVGVLYTFKYWCKPNVDFEKKILAQFGDLFFKKYLPVKNNIDNIFPLPYLILSLITSDNIYM